MISPEVEPAVTYWLKKAFSSLKVSTMLSHNDDFDSVPDTVAFQIYLSTGRSLKAYLVSCQSLIPETDSLKELLKACTQKDSSFCELLRDITILNPYRLAQYPDDRLIIEKERTLKALAHATKVFRFVEKKIKIPPYETLPLFKK